MLPGLVEGIGAEGKVTVVLYPITGLIDDQHDVLPNHSIAYYSQRKGAMNQLLKAPNYPCVIMTTPESLLNTKTSLAQYVNHLAEIGRLARIVIDEAHVLHDWSFRESYSKIGQWKQRYPKVPFTLCTATCTKEMEVFCLKSLCIDSGECIVHRYPLDRSNLTYYVRPKPLGKFEDSILMDEIATWILTFHKKGAGIIYVRTTAEAEQVAHWLKERGITAACYYGQMERVQKDKVMKAWMGKEVEESQKVQVVVATIAFGLGINRVSYYCSIYIIMSTQEYNPFIFIERFLSLMCVLCFIGVSRRISKRIIRNPAEPAAMGCLQIVCYSFGPKMSRR
jgi:superfamily II DNA helicase RecQ